MNVILDTNIWVSFLFGKHLHTVADLFSNENIHVYVSQQLIAELTSVLARSKIRQHISDQSIEAMWSLMREKCLPVEDYPSADSIVRDAKDIYLLAMAQAIPADYIVTGDKDLLVLGKYNGTTILSYNDFRLLLLGMNMQG